MVCEMEKFKIESTFVDLAELGVAPADREKILELYTRPDIERSETEFLQAVRDEFGMEAQGREIFAAVASWARVSLDKILRVLPSEMSDQFELPPEDEWSGLKKSAHIFEGPRSQENRWSRWNRRWDF